MPAKRIAPMGLGVAAQVPTTPVCCAPERRLDGGGSPTECYRNYFVGIGDSKARGATATYGSIRRC